MSAIHDSRAARLPMVTALLVDVIARLRRRLKKAKHTMSQISDTVAEMQELRRTIRRRYPYLEI